MCGGDVAGASCFHAVPLHCHVSSKRPFAFWPPNSSVVALSGSYAIAASERGAGRTDVPFTAQRLLRYVDVSSRNTMPLLPPPLPLPLPLPMPAQTGFPELPLP